MKKSTVIGMVAGGLLVFGVGVLAYIKREAVKQLAGQIADEAKKRLSKDKTANEETQAE